MRREARRLLIADLRNQGRRATIGLGFLVLTLWLALAFDKTVLTFNEWSTDDAGFLGLATIALSLAWLYRRPAPSLRTLCTLPLTQGEMGRVEWWATLGVPGILLAGSVTLEFAAYAARSATPHSLWAFAAWLLVLWGLLGYFAPLPDGLQAAGTGSFALATATAFFLPEAVQTVAVRFIEILLILLLAAGLLVAALRYLHPAGWLRRPLDTARAADRAFVRLDILPDSRLGRSDRVNMVLGWGFEAQRCQDGVSLELAIPTPFRRFGRAALILEWALQLLLDAFIAGAFAAWCWNQIEVKTGPLNAAGDMLTVLVAGLAACVAWYRSGRWLAAIRALRSLPFGSGALASILWGMPLLATSVFVLVLILARVLFAPDQSEPFPAELLSALVLLLPLPALMASAALHARAITRFRGCALLLLLGFWLSFVNLPYGRHFLAMDATTELVACVLIATALAAAGWLGMHRALRHSRHAYPPQRLAALIGSAHPGETAP